MDEAARRGAVGVVIAATTMFVAPAASADDGLSGAVDRVVEERLDELGVPGAVSVVVHDGEIVHDGGYGVADADTPVDVDDTVFFLGSVGKLFTATALARLIESGDVDPDADVNDHLTSIEIPDAFGEPITARQLLTYTAGFDPDGGMFGGVGSTPDGLPSLADSLADALPDRVRPPGETVAYDNFGYALAGLLIEDVTGTPFDEHLRETLFEPLGMDSTSASPAPPSALAERAAVGHLAPEPGEPPVVTRAQYGAWTPSGPSQVSTGPDMARFMIAQLAGTPPTTDAIAGEHFSATDALPGMGYAFEHRTIAGRAALVKLGDITGFHSAMVLIPEEGLGVFTVFNGDGTTTPDGLAVADTVVRRLGLDVDVPAPDLTASHPPADGFAGDYVSSRTATGSVFSLGALTTPSVTVSAAADGTLRTAGTTLSSRAVDEQLWIPIGGDVFQEADGPARIAFGADGSLASSLDPSVEYLPVAHWYTSPATHLALLLASIVVLAAAAVASPIAGLRARRRERSTVERIGSVATWLCAAAFTGWLVALATPLSGPSATEALLTGAASIVVAGIVGTVAVALTPAVVAVTVAAWIRSWWSVPARVAQTIVVVAALLAAFIAVDHSLVWPMID